MSLRLLMSSLVYTLQYTFADLPTTVWSSFSGPYVLDDSVQLACQLIYSFY